jgi:glucose-1-phosphate thymidylyltransferase
MKAVIPVAGIGTRLRPHTHTQPKALVPVAGKPILAHIVDTLIDGGVKDFVFIIGYLGSKIESFINTNYSKSNVKISFVVQEPREGISHAIYSAKEHLVNEKEILIMLGDSIIKIDFEELFTTPITTLGIKKVDVPGRFGVAELDKDNRVKRLVEKPKIPKSNLALVGIYKINNPVLLIESIEYLMNNNFKTYGEFQLTDALMHMIEKGEKMGVIGVDNWYDCGKKDSLLEANAILLGSPQFQNRYENEFPETIIVPPVSIGNNCRISGSIIGPNVAIGDNSIVSYSIVKNSIIGSYSEIQSAVLNNSIIGNDSSLYGISHSLNIGDNTEINFTH